MHEDPLWLPPTRRSDIELSDAAIRSAVRRGRLVTLRRGVLVGRAAFDETGSDLRARHALLAQGAILATQGAPAFACLGSAALLHGFARLGRPPQRIRLYRARGRPWRDSEVAILTCGLPDAHLTEAMNVPCTSAPRTVVDVARWVSFRGGMVVADSALRLGVERPALERVLRDCPRWPGIRKARSVIDFADRKAASPLESVSRVVFHEHGLPPPELQLAVAWDEFGDPTIIVDFCWPEFGVVGEADGLLKYDQELDPERVSLRAEKLRQEAIEALDYIVVRWTWDDIWRRPEWVVARIRRAMAEGARRRTA